MLDTLLDIAPFQWHSIAATLLCGMMIGLERQLRGKPVGIRTSSLVALGTYTFVAVSLSIHSDNTDPTRIIGQVVSGVGFLGAGVMLAKDGEVIGVTSAATIWVLAAIGTCIAMGYNFTGIKLALIAIAILYLVDHLEKVSSLFTRGVHSQYNLWREKSKNIFDGNDKDTDGR